MWTSLKNIETNDLVRINLTTLEKAVEIATAITEDRKDEAREKMVALTNEIAQRENSSFHQKLGLTSWSVRVAQDFMGGTLVAIDDTEAQELEAQKAMADLLG